MPFWEGPVAIYLWILFGMIQIMAASVFTTPLHSQADKTLKTTRFYRKATSRMPLPPLSVPSLPPCKAVVQSQVQTNEQLIQQTQCNSNVTSLEPINSHVLSTTITISVTCTGEVYQPQDAQNMALILLQHDAASNVNAIYHLIGKPIISITKAQVDNKGVIINMQANSMGLYQFSDIQKQQLARAIAGESELDAQVYLSQQVGVTRAVITIIPHNDNMLPKDPKQIAITLSS